MRDPTILMVVLTAIACSSPPSRTDAKTALAAPPADRAPGTASVEPPTPPASASVPAPSTGAPVPASQGRPCGVPGCSVFDTPPDAFAAVLASSPLVVGIGEAHALAGTEAIEPAVRRFTRDLLPLLRGKASDLVVELLIPNASCRKETAKAREEQKVVTEKQAASDQNDYVALAAAARALGIRAHALEPTCDDLARIAGAGPDAVTASLDVVTRLARESLERFYQRNVAQKDARAVVAYGGAMHNDLDPRPGREQWSFGPALSKLTGGRYVELDLIVPEFIADSPAWKALPWMRTFEPSAHPKETTLLSPESGSFVLVFPRTAAPAGPK